MLNQDIVHDFHLFLKLLSFVLFSFELLSKEHELELELWWGCEGIGDRKWMASQGWGGICLESHCTFTISIEFRYHSLLAPVLGIQIVLLIWSFGTFQILSFLLWLNRVPSLISWSQCRLSDVYLCVFNTLHGSFVCILFDSQLFWRSKESFGSGLRSLGLWSCFRSLAHSLWQLALFVLFTS